MSSTFWFVSKLIFLFSIFIGSSDIDSVVMVRCKIYPYGDNEYSCCGFVMANILCQIYFLCFIPYEVYLGSQSDRFSIYNPIDFEV